MNEVQIAEIPFENGELKYRYSRYLAEDGQRWIRHGLFQAYHPSGALASEGIYQHGLEHGPWRDFHQNGTLAAEGEYRDGVEVGEWRFWNADGIQEKIIAY